MITYRILREKIDQMTSDQLDSAVTAHLGLCDEFVPVDHLELVDSNEDDRLDDGHPVLIILKE